MLDKGKIFLGKKCNNNCVFCTILNMKAKSDKNFKSICLEILNLKKQGQSFVTLSGGESAPRKDLPNIVKFVKKLSLSVNLETNGRIFSYNHTANRFSKLGIKTFIVKVSGHNSYLHDSLTRTKDSFEQTVKGIKNLLDLKQHVVVNILVVRANYACLDKIVGYFRKLGITYFFVTLPPNQNIPKNKKLVLDTIPYLYRLRKQFKKLTFRFFNVDQNFLESYSKHFPKNIYIDVTSKCNLHCAVCSLTLHKNMKKRDMSFEEFKKVIDEVHIPGDRLIIPAVGEATLNNDLYGMIRYAKDRGVGEINLLTNGLKLDDKDLELVFSSGLDNIYVALDGASKQTYSKFRIGGDFNKVKKNLERIIKRKKKFGALKPLIIIGFLVNRYNEKEIPLIKKMAKTMGADGVNLKFIDFGSSFKSKAKDFLPDNLNFSVYKNKKLEKKQYNDYSFCEAPWTDCVVSYDGSVYLCCKHAINRSHSIGNLLNSSFSELWNNPRYVSLRKGFLENKKKNIICKECTGRIHRSKLITFFREGSVKNN